MLTAQTIGLLVSTHLTVPVATQTFTSHTNELHLIAWIIEHKQNNLLLRYTIVTTGIATATVSHFTQYFQCLF